MRLPVQGGHKLWNCCPFRAPQHVLQSLKLCLLRLCVLGLPNQLPSFAARDFLLSHRLLLAGSVRPMDACRDRFLKGRHDHAIAKIAAEVLTSGSLFEPSKGRWRKVT